MDKYSEQNKIAWEYNAYDFWVSQSGTPAERAKKDLENPRAMLKNYSKYFDDVKGLKIANICGSCGKKAVPLSIKSFDEYPAWENEKLPGEFTLLADKITI